MTKQYIFAGVRIRNFFPRIRIQLRLSWEKNSYPALPILVYILLILKMKIDSYIRSYRMEPEPDPMKKVSDPYPAGQKSTDPILIHSLVKAIFTRHHSVNDAIQF